MSGENTALQAKTSAMSSMAGALQRRALGEIRGHNIKFPGKAAVRTEGVHPVTEVMADVEVESPEKQEEVEDVPHIPDGVQDIDTSEDHNNPQLCVEYASAIYSYLRKVENGLSIKKDFLQGCNVNGKMRGVLVDWLVEVHSQFKLLQETLYMTVYIVDKFLQSEGYSIRRNKLQLVGVTAMFIASKVEEMYAPEINDFVYITDNAYSSGEVRQMELRMLNTLGFNFSRPLPLHFLRRNSKAGDVDVVQHTLAKYLVEMSLVEYSMAHIPPSLIASAGLLLSLMILEPQAGTGAWSPTLQYYSTYQREDLLPVVSQLAVLLTSRTEHKLQAIHTKYKGAKFMRVAQLKQLERQIVQDLITRK